ncbi:MAG: dihydroorotate dehydrogenase [Chrysothrix sp. TS-e1954]|nr:MAG: dihydroorotate dehydrogenase [Chrysothrix sp. TS-e1954]
MALRFDPPYLNSAGPWATSREDLQALYECRHTGAVTTRTGTLDGFAQDPKVHAWGYFDARSNAPLPERSPNANSSINSLGYSPRPLDQILDDVEAVAQHAHATRGVSPSKPFIVSVTGTADQVSECYDRVAQRRSATNLDLLLEVNLSCPNIHERPPPAHDQVVLQEYLLKLRSAMVSSAHQQPVTVGIKLPPYTYIAQFQAVVAGLQATASADGASCISFVTSTNTLGNCLVLAPSSDGPAPLTSSTTSSMAPPTTNGVLEGDDAQSHPQDQIQNQPGEPTYRPALTSESGTGHGGVGGAAIHPLSLGNVATLRRLLDEREELRGIEILGTGGVSNWEGAARMRAVGARAVGIGTAVGKDGTDVFGRIAVEGGGVVN